MKYLSLFALLVISQNAYTVESKVIYGEDDRKDVYEEKNDHYVELARSTAAMMPDSSIKRNRGVVKIVGDKLTERGYCSSEKFSNQIAAAYCSGFLVGPNLLVTAGHCIEGNNDCKKYKWVFDFKVNYKGQGEYVSSEKNIYSCKSIVERKLVGTGADYALIRLDREVEGRSPLRFRRSGQVDLEEGLVVIGHPTGLPTKIADGAKVRSQKTGYFVANLDTYGGNSGSAVFNSRTHEVEGILVRGETDYVYDYQKKCYKSNYCSNSGCRGEDVTRITEIKSLNL